MIIVPKSKRVESSPLVVPASVMAIVTLRALHEGCVARELTFRNMITNGGLNRWGIDGSVFSLLNAYVGTGTTPPQYTDQSLAAFAARVGQNSASSSAYVSGAEPYTSRTATVTSAIGFYAGNLTEVGFRWNGDNRNDLDARALILDASGNPTVFPIFSTEQLQVSYEFRNYIPQGDVEGEVYIGSQLTDTITRAAQAGAAYWANWGGYGATRGTFATGVGVYSGAIGPVTGVPSGIIGQPSSIAPQPYVANTYETTHVHTWLPAAGNGTIRSAVAQSGNSSFQTEYSPTFTKTSDDSMILRFTFGWGRKE